MVAGPKLDFVGASEVRWVGAVLYFVPINLVPMRLALLFDVSTFHCGFDKHVRKLAV
jgi:hypothetical protein